MFAIHVFMFLVPVVWGTATGWSRPALSPIPGVDAGDVGFYILLTLFPLGPITLPVAGLLGRAFARRRRRQIGGRSTFDFQEYIDDLSSQGWTVLAATVFGVGAALTALFVSLLSLGGVSPIGALVFGFLFVPGAVVGGFAVGGLLWWVLVESRRTPSYVTGTLVGVLTALLTHFVVPLFHVLGIYAPRLGIFRRTGVSSIRS